MREQQASVSAPDTLSVVTLNIWHNQQNWPARLAMIVAGLHDLNPDVIFLQEVLENEDLPNQAQTITDSLGYSMYFASVDSAAAPKRYGNAILTRHPVLAEGWKALEPMTDYRVVAHVRIDVDGQPVNVYDTHLHHTPEGDSIRQTQTEDLMAFIEATRDDAPVVLAGDFNTTADAPELDALRGGLQDVYGALYPQKNTVTTLNPALGHTPRRIDHVFVPLSATPLAASLLFDQPGPGSLWASDHFGLFAQFVLKY